MIVAFETWLHEVAPRDELDPGARPAGAEELLRQIFDLRGPISVQDLRAEGEKCQLDLARGAVALVLRDVHATTEARPNVEVRLDDEDGLIVGYNGGWTTPPMMSLRNPEATREIADYLQGEVMENNAVWAAWPTCSKHQIGLHAHVHDDAAVWYCRTGDHAVAGIGHLTP